MEPQLLIIKYLFKKKGIDNIDNSIDEFFENGLSFPQFISLIFDVDEIPKINKNPKTLFHKKMNNDVALQFLCQKNATIGKCNPNYYTEHDKMNLLLLIFTKQCFNININEIITKSNLIVQSLNIKYEKKKDIISLNCLLSLLNVLSDGKVQINNDIDVNKNFDEIIVHSFSLANAPLVINKSSLDIQNQNIFLIQIEILFDYFSNKINQIENKYQLNTIQNVPKHSSLNDNDQQHTNIISESKIFQQLQDQQPIQKVTELTIQANNNIENNQINQKEIQNDYEEDEEDEEEEEKKVEESIEEEIDEDQKDILLEKDDLKIKDIIVELEDEALLKTLNAVGGRKFHFNNFHDSVINDSIPRFVLFFFNLKSIKGVHIKHKKSNEINQKITKNELKNINAVIKFLGTKEIKFNILKFDFKDHKKEESSAILFYSNFLHFFFIKTTKRDIYERCAILLCTKKTLDNYNNFKELNIDSTYGALVHFVTKKNLHFDFSDFPDKIEDLAPVFENARIPLVLKSKIFKFRYGFILSDSIFYQLQLIFDAIDSGPKSFVVFERLLKIIYNLQKLKVPKYDEIAGNILAKRTSIEFQNARSNQYLKRADSKNLSESFSCFENIQIEPIKEPIKINTYYTRHQESKQNNSIQGSNIEIKFNASSDINEQFEKLLKPIDSNFKFENGVLYDKTKDQNQFQQEWIKELTNIKKIDKKEKTNKRDSQSKEDHLFYKFNNSINSKLYKIFIYDETNKNWKFQSDVFQQFATDKYINFNNAKTPIALILDSNKDDSVSFISNLINGIHPKLDDEQDIFIYSLCDKPLLLLNFYINLQNTIESSIKPLFLLLHIPKAKENLPNLQHIVFEIYLFLTFVSDIEIVILNKNHYDDQILLMKSIKDAYKYYKIKYIKYSSSSSSDISQSSSSDKSQSSSSSDKSQSSSSSSDKFQSSSSSSSDEMEEDTWDEVSIIDDKNNKISNEKYFSDIYLKRSVLILLVNDPEIHSSEDVKENLKKNAFFQNLKLRIDDKKVDKILCINVKEPDSYERFLISFNNELRLHYSKFSEVKTNFHAISFFKLQSSYTKIRCNGYSWKETFKNMIMNRYEELKSDFSLPSKNTFVVVSQLSNELAQIIPFFDIEFVNEYNLILSDLNSAGTKLNRELYLNELEKSADSHLAFLNEKINEKFFWTEEQMDLLIKSHYSFLKDEFYDIIRLSSSIQIYNIIYEENYDILENQMKKSKTKIDDAFKPYIEKLKIKKTTKEQDINEQIKKSANYCMKETENQREIKVAVQIKKDLKSEIDQDF